MGGRASAGEGILFYVAIAPNILLAKIQDIFRPVPECGAVAGLVDVGIARALQRVPDVHQFLRAGGGGITQGAQETEKIIMIILKFILIIAMLGVAERIIEIMDHMLIAVSYTHLRFYKNRKS